MKPILREITSDYSAEEVYALFSNEENSVFLDSAMDVENMGRYSFVGRDPFLLFTSKDARITIQDDAGKRSVAGNSFTILKELLAQYSTEKLPHYPPLAGGIIGYFGYEMGYLLEDIAKNQHKDKNLPDCCFGFYDTILIFDQHEKKTYIASTGFPEKNEKERLGRANRRIDEWLELMQQASFLGVPHQPIPQGTYTSHFTKESYCSMVEKAIAYIGAGDIFQVNVSQRFSADLTVSPFELYRYLRYINPAPFASYLNFGEVVVASTSPERYLRLENRRIETRPIKGTRPRGSDKHSDSQLRQELLASEKDQAELVMIIDLERNDLGRVCAFGSVHVPDLIRLEEYPTVFHLVSTVTGELTKDKGILDAVMASFPGGSITGTPKVRAMEIIAELEPVKRGIYTGSIGYIDFNGDADLNIVIRTIVIQGGQAYFQVGGGIVADSVPELEYIETLDKALALMKALGFKG
ncbi:aminodeoxychorismate synthase component I [Pelosinus fermentans]|uniref:aminodeoxychorismate synthase n=1 Tax=Pelosinus fermentans JBW45 TaxID=1192197 RepID=I9NTE8_9FIRM|nr:aminodeoxychorismate synthase component I [Pelosinus fermentans]AJQ26446.1 para-aminobenzoate synthase, subunit I [Pelosinus fermentans JBW45]